MVYKRMFVFVEGPDDVMFFSRIVEPLLKRYFDFVNIQTWADKPDKYKANFIKSIKSIENADYIYVADIDQVSCVTRKKEKIVGNLGCITNDRIVVVAKEIESWYLAGLKEHKLKEFKIGKVPDTNEVSKEVFERLMPTKFKSSRINFMIEILNYYDIEAAKEKNISFKYFHERYAKSA